MHGAKAEKTASCENGSSAVRGHWRYWLSRMGWRSYLWCPAAVGVAAEAAEEAEEGISDSGMPAGTVH